MRCFVHTINCNNNQSLALSSLTFMFKNRIFNTFKLFSFLRTQINTNMLVFARFSFFPKRKYTLVHQSVYIHVICITGRYAYMHLYLNDGSVLHFKRQSCQLFSIE